MLLRRVIEHVRAQNWTAVAIDFVIVVVGVFVGIQVANWNEERLDDRRADAYLARIASDLATDIEGIDMRAAFWREVIAEGEIAVRHAESGALENGSAWRTALAFYQASQVFPYVYTDTTYEELKSSGELGLIRDAGLRSGLSEYYALGSAEQAGFLTRLIPPYRETIRGKTPLVMARHIWRECITTDGLARQMLVECGAPFGAEEARAALAGYTADRRVIEELRTWIGNQEIALILLGHNREAAGEMLARIEALRRH